MPLDDPVQARAIQHYMQRLFHGVSRSPALKAFPTKSVRRVDLARLRAHDRHLAFDRLLLRQQDFPLQQRVAVIHASDQLSLAFFWIIPNRAPERSR